MTDLPTNQSPSRGVTEGSSAGAISLEPPGTTPPNRHLATVAVPTRSVVVVHDATQPSAFRLVIGLVLVCAAVLVCSTPHEIWRDMFGKDSFDQYAPPVAGGLLALLGGLRLKSSISHLLHFCVTSVLVCSTAIIGDMLLNGGVPWRWLILGGVALAYLIHASGRVGRISVLGMLGWMLVGVACVGSVRGWYDFSRPGAWAGGNIEDFLLEWGTECTWGTVLLLTAIGVSCSRTRPICFLNAVLLAILAYHCFWGGYLEWVSFPELGANIKPLPSYDLDNIAPWRWVLIGEFVLLSLVLLNMALRVGALVVVFAVVWLSVASLYVDQKMGPAAFLGYVSAAEVPVKADTDANRQDTPTARPPKASLPTMGTSGRRPVQPVTMAVKQTMLQRAIGLIAGIYAWVYLTAALSGMIAAAGLRMLIKHERLRMWTAFALWGAFGAGLGWISSIWPEIGSWSDFATAFVVPTSHEYAILLTALGSAAVFGSWSLRRSSSYRTWLLAGSAFIFLGTALTLVAIALLIRFVGLSPMPVWAYAVVTAGQSSMMWVLLMHESTRARRVPAAL